MTSPDWTTILDEIEGKAKDARKHRIEVETALAEALVNGADDEVCGPYPEQCFGAMDIDFVSDVPCPLDLKGDCPYATARERYRRHRYLKALGFGERAWDPRIEAVEESVQYAVQTYCDNIAQRINDGIGLLITGPVGVGKTCIQALVAWAAAGWAVPRPSLVYASSRKLFMSLASDQTDMASLAAQAARADLLLLDDFGVEGLTGWKKSAGIAAFHELIDTRWHKHRATVLASNQSLEELGRNREFKRAIDRLRQCAAEIEVSATVPSQRGRQLPPADQGTMPFQIND